MTSRLHTYMCVVVPAAEIRDHETGLVSGPFSWFQSRQLFLETHEIEANSISYNKHTLWKGRLRLWVCRCFYLNSGLKNLLAMPSVMNVIPSSLRILFELLMRCSDAGRWKTLGVPVVITSDSRKKIPRVVVYYYYDWYLFSRIRR